MAKSNGGVRNVANGSKAHQNRIAEVAQMRASGKYSSVEMYNTGWVAIEKSKAKHKPEEIEAAKHLASKGYKVTLKSEDGHLTTPDGYAFKYVYEQRTPKDAIGANGVMRTIEHARKKVTDTQNIDIALIYDKHQRFTRKDVDEGVKMYEKYNRHRFKRIIVVSASGNIHIHKHND